MQVEFGTRVKLKEDFVRENEFLKSVKRGEVRDLSASQAMPTRLVIPRGSEGVVTVGSPYASDCYDYARETPVNFDMFSKGRGVRFYAKEFSIGIPDNLLQVVREREVVRAH